MSKVIYDWAANEMKLQLAISDLKKVGAEITEESIKTAYIKRAGLVYDTSVEVKEPVKVEEAPVVKSVRRPLKR